MAFGQGGRYDAECQELMVRLKAHGLLLVVLDGTRGNGFSVTIEPTWLATLPELLESVAGQIRADLAQLEAVSRGKTS